MKVTVRIFENESEILSKELVEGTHKLGRSNTCIIQLPHESVSRYHLEFRITESAVYMTNLSTGGEVAVNGILVETTELSNGDQILIGPYKVLVTIGKRRNTNSRLTMLETPAQKEGTHQLILEEVPEVAVESPVNNLVAPEEIAPVAVIDPLPDPVAEYQPSSKEMSLASNPLAGNTALSASQTQIQDRPLVAKLLFVEGPKKGEEIFLETYEVNFGRSKKADIFLDDHKLSRIHCKISRVGIGYRLIDLGSRNGTYVNGMRVLEHPLNSFDIIAFGSTKIKFLIHQMAIEPSRSLSRSRPAPDQTKSLQMTPEDAQAMALELQRATPFPRGPTTLEPIIPIVVAPEKKGFPGLKLILLGALLGIVLLVLVPNEKKDAKPAPSTESIKESTPQLKTPPLIPKEFMDLSPEVQKNIEGLYNSAIRAAEEEGFAEAGAALTKIHDQIPYYKQSRELLDQFSKRLKEQQVAEALERAKRDEKQSLQLHLEEGIAYLKEGDFDRALEAFTSAINIDPNNTTAAKGIKAVEYRVRDMDKIPQEKDIEQEKKNRVLDLLTKSLAALDNKSYQEAIDAAEKVRQIEIRGTTSYLNQAKQIIDKARIAQKEEFEPFLVQAKEKFAEGDYNSSRDLCEEMLKRDPAYEEAKECSLKAKRQLNRLAKEAYTHGYILESMNKIEEAKQFWNRAKNYVRPGDEYYNKIIKKLENYQ